MSMISVSGQLFANDIEQLHKAGVKTIINNRPDGEDSNQPTSDELARICQDFGIAYKQIAFAGGMMTMAHVQDFADFYNDSLKPIHIFCRTGNRSSAILAKARELDLLDDE